jgi:phosphatidylglycerophosphate synthase
MYFSSFCAMTAALPPFNGLTRRTALYVAFGGACVAGAATAIAARPPFTEGFVVGALVSYLTVGLIAVARVAHFHPFARFGIANGLTLIRLGLCALIGGLAAEVAIQEVTPAPAAAWGFFGLATLAMVIDGLDGYIARKNAMTSDFGARFDMEVDALQILLLCIVALGLGKAGLWVLIGGLLRYLYEIVGVWWPVLQNPLPPSFRRKLISVVQGGSLIALLAPVIVPPFSMWVAGIALALLLYSFAVDVVFLAREDRQRRRV